MKILILIDYYFMYIYAIFHKSIIQIIDILFNHIYFVSKLIDLSLVIVNKKSKKYLILLFFRHLFSGGVIVENIQNK